MMGIKLPFAVTSNANARGHTKARSAGPKRQRTLTGLTLTALGVKQAQPSEAFLVTFTRVAPRLYDEGDNLPMSFKAVRDAVAEHLGLSDSAYQSARVEWLYRQEKSPKGSLETAWLDIRATEPSTLTAMRERIAVEHAKAKAASRSVP